MKIKAIQVPDSEHDVIAINITTTIFDHPPEPHVTRLVFFNPDLQCGGAVCSDMDVIIR